MKYDEKSFNSAIQDYKDKIKGAKGKCFLVIFDILNKNAFYSLAPLSRALHELGADACCIGMYKNSDSYNALGEVWDAHQQIKSGLDSERSRALKDFIGEVEKKAKVEFGKIFGAHQRYRPNGRKMKLYIWNERCTGHQGNVLQNWILLRRGKKSPAVNRGRMIRKQNTLRALSIGVVAVRMNVYPFPSQVQKKM